MKKNIFSLITAVLLIFSCSQDASNTSSDLSIDGQGGSLATFTLKGDYLYTVDFFNLSVFNISDINNPIKVNTIDVGFNIETLFSFKDYLFIGSQDAMYIYDVTNAELPEKLSQSNHFRACDPVVANDTNAYVTLHSNATCGGSVNELKTYNIEDIENPILLNTRGLTQPKGLSLYGNNYLLVCDDTVKIFDVSDPNDSKFLDEIETENAIDIIIRNDNAFIISEYTIEQYQLNYNDITNPIKISTTTF
ncbi:hypothetical protein BW723_06210 [Polaribacter reichenbachii]|uniref:LVIVD repeat-containing protein n=1 Tax=Polaribacter reichenbachii TaxID=996801 RepID=A0A1B8TY66_9FLAO|nr:hypothetical protein [Polaribacter reichenbachii]APZ45913.1 hypothetical protein BW723_06210 [Polaribacter reichenbachii]AUC19775.1 hypothetical protein BTO17_14225 [Polaribacter reichenbachii]OBY64656.1 hypothetical protein LPB301_09510 [Polaribacter reichenbachii]